MTQLPYTSSVSINSEISWAQALTLIPETRAFVCFLTPRAVLSLDQSFFTHDRTGEFIRPPFSSLHFLGPAVCSADPQVESVLCLAVVYLCFIPSRPLAVVWVQFLSIFYILINSERTPSIYVTDRNFQFGHRPSLVIKMYAFRQYF